MNYLLCVRTYLSILVDGDWKTAEPTPCHQEPRGGVGAQPAL